MKLEEVNKQIQACNYCPFLEYKYNSAKEYGHGHCNKIMFVGNSPSVLSNKRNKFSSFDIYFSKLLAKVELTSKDYYFTNLCKTSIPPGVILTEDQVKHCLSHLNKEIIAVKPQIVVLLGKQVRDAFNINWPGSVNVKIVSAAGEKHKTVFYTLPHPGFLKYFPDEEERYLQNLKKIFKVYKRPLF